MITSLSPSGIRVSIVALSAATELGCFLYCLVAEQSRQNKIQPIVNASAFNRQYIESRSLPAVGCGRGCWNYRKYTLWVARIVGGEKAVAAGAFGYALIELQSVLLILPYQLHSWLKHEKQPALVMPYSGKVSKL